MSSNSDSKSGAARALKRGVSQSLCEDERCEGFGKSLGNGYCEECCFSRGVRYKPKKNSKQTPVIATSPPASDPQNAKEPVPSSVDVYFVNKATEAVKSVSFEDLLAWMVKKGAVDPNCENLWQKEDLILLMAQNKMEYDVHFLVDDSDDKPHQTPSEYEKVLNSLAPDQFTAGSPPRSDLDGGAAAVHVGTSTPRIGYGAGTVEKVTADDLATPPKKSPSKELSALRKDTADAMQTFRHRSVIADSSQRGSYPVHPVGYIPPIHFSASPSQQQQRQELPLYTTNFNDQLPSRSTDGANIDDVYLQMGIDVEERWISNEMGYGIFCLKEIPADVDVTTYDGPRVNCHTGEILFECPFTHGIEKKYTASKQFTRSRKWGDYEREHCVLLEHSNDVCIDGTFSSQPFLFTEGFHGGTGFGANFNSGKGIFVNIKKLYKRSSRFAYDPNGQLDQVTLSSNN